MGSQDSLREAQDWLMGSLGFASRCLGLAYGVVGFASRGAELASRVVRIRFEMHRIDFWGC